MPSPLDRILGQPIASALLARALQSGRLSHAYLFVGPAQTGKRTMAQALAETLFGRPPEGHPDWRLWAPENKSGTIAIDQIRDLIDSCTTPPLQAPYQIRVIDHAEGLAKDSGNALLKILEEPPPRTLLILLAEQFDLILPTLVSRAQVIPFRPVAQDVIVQALLEKGLSQEEAERVALSSRGRIGAALTHDAPVTTDNWPGDGPQDRLTWVNDGMGRPSQALIQSLSLWQQRLWRSRPEPATRPQLEAIEEAIRQLDRNANARLVLEQLASRLN